MVSSPPSRPSPSTDRSRRLPPAERRRGTRCITVDVNEGEIAGLVAGGYLPKEAHGDPVAIKAAIEVVDFDELFGLCAALSRRNPNNARRHRRTFTRGAR